MDKSETRKMILDRIKAMSEEEKERESLAVVKTIKGLPIYQFCDHILAFSPLKSEVQLGEILGDERVLLPAIKDGHMFFASAKEGLRKTDLGFNEPVSEIEKSYSFALMMVPLVGFDRHLFRLGRGGGFYDRYIAENRDRLFLVGIAYTPSYQDDIPKENHDQRLDMVITADKIFSAN